ncbi:glycosyltransferase [Humidesulfovibrio idahonensis]
MTIILHDYIDATDGGSRLCLELGRGLGAPLLCGFVRKGHPYLEAGYPPGLRTLLPTLPIPLLRQYLLAQAFAGRGAVLVADHRTAIFSGTYAPLAVLQQPKQDGNVLYCHTPPRFLYDDAEMFLRGVAAPLRGPLRYFCDWLRPRYEAAVAQMDVVVANSQTVRERIARLLRREAVVVSPPCATSTFQWRPAAGYYLSHVRLDRLKRVDRVISAFLAMPDRSLVITSNGPETRPLLRLARGAPNIRFVGPLSETRYREALAGCIATINVAWAEDFGMSAVESMASGKPVIAARGGGLAETVVHGWTGTLLSPDPDPDEVRDAVLALGPTRAAAMREECQRRARCYDTAHFLTAMRSVIASAGRD